MAPNLFSLTNGPTKSSTKAPSYSYIPPFGSALKDNGEKQFQRTVSAMLIAINRLVPDPPIPYPFDMISSKRMVTTEARTNCTMIKIAFPAPMTAISPYIPDQV